MEKSMTGTERHLPYGITQCYLLPAPRLNPCSNAGRYSIYLPRRDGRL